MSAPDDNTITAKSIKIVDKDNNTRIIMSCGEDGPAIIFTDQDKSPALGFIVATDKTTGDEVSGITFFDGNNPGIQIQLDQNGPAIMMLDKDGQERLSLGSRDGSAVVMRDEKGEIRILQVVNDEGPQIYFLEPDGSINKRVK